jgi:hypothetical protein
MQTWRTIGLSAMLVVTGLLAGLLIEPSRAQVGGVAGSRYQISAYGTGAGGFNYGCYVIDTTTGRLWHVKEAGKLVEIAAELK